MHVHMYIAVNVCRIFQDNKSLDQALQELRLVWMSISKMEKPISVKASVCIFILNMVTEIVPE